MPRTRSSPAEVVARPPGQLGGQRRRKRSRGRRLWLRVRWPLLALGVVCLAAAVDVLVRYLPAVNALQHGRDDVSQVQSLMTGDLAHLDRARIAQARSLLADAELDFGSRSSILSDGWIAGVADHLPWIASQVDAARQLRIAGEDGAAVGTNVVALVDQLVPTSGNSQQSLLARLVGVAQDHTGDLTTLSQQLATLQTDIASLPSGPLLGPLDSARATLRGQGGQVLATAMPAIALLKALPPVIGAGTHTYVLLLENPGELRPGGGYIGAVGQVTFTDGALTAQVFRDSAYFDPLVRDIPAPRPFNTYLQRGQPWNIGDADWSPDFPSAVTDVNRFYTEATGVKPDGVIAVDPVALGGLLAVTGPITVPPYPQVITSANILPELNYISNMARPGDPGKVFLPPFGQAVTARLIQAGLGEAPALATHLADSAAHHHVVLFFNDSKMEQLVRGAGFDGGVRAPLGDSLQVLDANLSGSKADLFVTRHLSLSVNVSDSGQAHDTLTITYHNPRPATAADAALVVESGGAYRDYIQALLPETAQFDGLTVGFDGGPATPLGPEAVTYDFHRQDVAYWLIVPPGSTATLTLSYEGPFADISQSPASYSLSWERQTGALDWPVDLTVTLPNSAPRHWSSDLSVDRTWAVSAGR